MSTEPEVPKEAVKAPEPLEFGSVLPEEEVSFAVEVKEFFKDPKDNSPHDQPKPKHESKLSVEEITKYAYKVVEDYKETIKEWYQKKHFDDLTLEEITQWKELTHYYIQTAANPNSYQECQRIHDVKAAELLKKGVDYDDHETEISTPYVLPFFTLPPEIRTELILYRSVVLALLNVWSMS